PNSSICTGSLIQLSASGGTSYAWSPAGTLNNPNISNPVASPASTTTYSVTVTDANNCSSKASTMVNVNAILSVSASPNTSVCYGSATQLTSEGGATFTWTPSASISNPNIPDPFADPLITTTYTVTSTDANGCSGKTTVKVTVNDLPIVNANSDTS